MTSGLEMWCFINLSLTYLLDTYPLTYSPGPHGAALSFLQPTRDSWWNWHCPIYTGFLTGLLNSIYCHFRWSYRENRLISDDRHSSRQAATEDRWSLFEWLSVKHDSADWWSVGKRLQAHGAAPYAAAKADGTQQTVCSEVRPGDGDRTSGRSLPSQPGRCVHLRRALWLRKRFTTHCCVRRRRPCWYHARAPFTGIPASATAREHCRTVPAAATSL